MVLFTILGGILGTFQFCFIDILFSFSIFLAIVFVVLLVLYFYLKRRETNVSFNKKAN